ncbi:PAS domain-containing protein, partial [bacterium]|nr:PAS domain-containing protein [bacterium]
LRTKIQLSLFLILAFGGVAINIIFYKVIYQTLSNAGLSPLILENISKQFTIVGTGVTIAGIIVVLSISSLIAWSVTKPLQKLTDGMLDITHGNLSTRIHVNSNDEVGQLAQGFNAMASHVEESLHALSNAKQYTDNILMSVPSILIALSSQQQVLSTNKAYERLYSQFPSIQISQFIEPLQDQITRSLETGETTWQEIQLVPAHTRQHLIFSITVSRVAESGQKDPMVLLTITDITERKKMRELILQSKQDWEDTFNTIPDMVTIHDKDYNIIQANNAAREALKLPKVDFGVNNKCFKFYHGTEQAPSGCPSCNCYNTAKPATFELYEPYLKKFVEIRSIPRLSSNNEVIGLIHIVRDISTRKKIEEEHNKLIGEITKAKMEREMTFDSVTEFVVLIDNDLTITRCNKSFQKFVNKGIGDIKGGHCYNFFPCKDDQVALCKNRMSDGCELPAKTDLQTSDNHWLYISHMPIQDERNKLLKSVIIATDVTELKSAQKKVNESEQQLHEKINDLEKFYDMAIGRELKMKNLKKEIKKLNSEILSSREN